MRKFAILSSFLMILASGCKPMYDRDGLDPVSDLERAVSHDGTVLFAVSAGRGGLCMFSSTYNAQYHHHKDAKLLTEKGAISVRQLRSALLYMGYEEHLITTAVVVAGGIAGGAIAAAGAPVAGAVLAITGLVGGGFGYRVIRGTTEGEKIESIMNRSITDTFSLTLLAPLHEYFHRRGRLEAVVSDKHEVIFTSKRMAKLLAKLATIDPQFPRECDHLKEGLQQHSPINAP